MKYIIAVLKPHKLDAVRDALSNIGVNGMTVSEVKGYGRQRGQAEIYRGTEYQVHFVPKAKIEVAVADAQLEATVEAIQTAAETGKIGDGKIFVLELTNSVRIRTGEQGEDAL